MSPIIYQGVHRRDMSTLDEVVRLAELWNASSSQSIGAYDPFLSVGGFASVLGTVERCIAEPTSCMAGLREAGRMLSRRSVGSTTHDVYSYMMTTPVYVELRVSTRLLQSIARVLVSSTGGEAVGGDAHVCGCPRSTALLALEHCDLALLGACESKVLVDVAFAVAATIACPMHWSESGVSPGHEPATPTVDGVASTPSSSSSSVSSSSSLTGEALATWLVVVPLRALANLFLACGASSGSHRAALAERMKAQPQDVLLFSSLKEVVTAASSAEVVEAYTVALEALAPTLADTDLWALFRGEGGANELNAPIFAAVQACTRGTRNAEDRKEVSTVADGKEGEESGCITRRLDAFSRLWATSQRVQGFHLPDASAVAVPSYLFKQKRAHAHVLGVECVCAIIAAHGQRVSKGLACDGRLFLVAAETLNKQVFSSTSTNHLHSLADSDRSRGVLSRCTQLARSTMSGVARILALDDLCGLLVYWTPPARSTRAVPRTAALAVAEALAAAFLHHGEGASDVTGTGAGAVVVDWNAFVTGDYVHQSSMFVSSSAHTSDKGLFPSPNDDPNLEVVGHQVLKLLCLLHVCIQTLLEVVATTEVATEAEEAQAAVQGAVRTWSAVVRSMVELFKDCCANHQSITFETGCNTDARDQGEVTGESTNCLMFTGDGDRVLRHVPQPKASAVDSFVIGIYTLVAGTDVCASPVASVSPAASAAAAAALRVHETQLESMWWMLHGLSAFSTTLPAAPLPSCYECSDGAWAVAVAHLSSDTAPFNRAIIRMLVLSLMHCQVARGSEGETGYSHATGHGCLLGAAAVRVVRSFAESEAELLREVLELLCPLVVCLSAPPTPLAIVREARHPFLADADANADAGVGDGMMCTAPIRIYHAYAGGGAVGEGMVAGSSGMGHAPCRLILGVAHKALELMTRLAVGGCSGASDGASASVAASVANEDLTGALFHIMSVPLLVLATCPPQMTQLLRGCGILIDQGGGSGEAGTGTQSMGWWDDVLQWYLDLLAAFPHTPARSAFASGIALWVNGSSGCLSFADVNHVILLACHGLDKITTWQADPAHAWGDACDALERDLCAVVATCACSVHQALLRDDSVMSMSMSSDNHDRSLMDAAYGSLLAAPTLFPLQFARQKVVVEGSGVPRASLYIILKEVVAVAHRLKHASAAQAARNMLDEVDREGERQQSVQGCVDVRECVAAVVAEMDRRHVSSPNKSSTKRKSDANAHNAHDNDGNDDDDGDDGTLSPTQANSPGHYMLEELHETISEVRNKIVGLVQQGGVDGKQKAALLRQLEDCCDVAK